MIKEIRSYFDRQIRSVDPDLRFDGYVFFNDTISSNNIDKSYKLLIGNVKISRRDVINEARVSVTVLIFKVSGTNRVDDFDKVFCKAIALQSKITNQTLITQDDYIKSIFVNSISPEVIESDDNSVRMKLEFEVITYYSLEE